ncbi:MAG: CocE/NonD family hydrolase, partial [Dehalococcoidia bacterium]|nr:CocE/NonD family hydrolase [Dehalococcoidia bacterium]
MAVKKDNGASQPRYGINVEYDVYVKMRDGVRLCVDIYRPDAKGRFPALLGVSPLGKRVQVRLYDTSIIAEAGDPNYIVPKGYGHIVADVRGSGKSEGEMQTFNSKQEQEDNYDLVEWIAQQSWCDSNIGMVGISYFAVSQMLVAALQPPHLKAILAYDSPGDWYREGIYDGGIFSEFLFQIYRRNIAVKNAVSVMVKNTPPEELERLVKEKENDTDINIDSRYVNVLENPGSNPFAFDYLLNPTDGPFYWERSPYTKYDKIKIPVYCGSGWYGYPISHLAGAFRNYAGLNVPKKLIISGPLFRGLEHPLAFSWREYHELLMRWYDYWLKGIDTGIMDEPPIKLFVMGVNKWRYENEWPLARTKWTKFYLRSMGRLSDEPETRVDDPDCFVQMPRNMTNVIQSLKYTTVPFVEPVEVTGPIALYIYASIDQENTNWIAILKDIAPDGSERELTRGWLKASHRAIDPGKSKPWSPYHIHINPEPVKPGKIYEYAI